MHRFRYLHQWQRKALVTQDKQLGQVEKGVRPGTHTPCLGQETHVTGN